jgi:hypothetical protein
MAVAVCRPLTCAGHAGVPVASRATEKSSAQTVEFDNARGTGLRRQERRHSQGTQEQKKEKLMKKIGRGLVAALAIGTLVVGLAGCKKEGPGERVGKEVDKAGEKVKDAVQDLKK